MGAAPVPLLSRAPLQPVLTQEQPKNLLDRVQRTSYVLRQSLVAFQACYHTRAIPDVFSGPGKAIVAG